MELTPPAITKAMAAPGFMPCPISPSSSGIAA
jgi:hypothetical protein